MWPASSFKPQFASTTLPRQHARWRTFPAKPTFREADYPVPRAWHEGLLAKLRQDAPAAHAAFMAARAETERLVRTQPQNATPASMLALIDAELGDKEKAIREGRTACDMVPVSKDALEGVLLITNLARIYTLTGEKDLALEQLETVSKLPCGPTYGALRLDPEWNLLRGDPRFEKIVASLALKPGGQITRCYALAISASH